MFGLSNQERVLVLAPHPDDEVLGAGGTLARLAAEGTRVDVLVVACPDRPMHGAGGDPDVRAGDLATAGAILGAASTHIAWSGTEPAALAPGAHMPQLVALIEQALADGPTPAALLLPSGGHHQDHRAVRDAALAAIRPGHRENRPLPRLVLGFDGPEDRLHLTAGLSRPVVIDVTDHHPTKLKALAAYAGQMRPAPHPRSLQVVTAQDAVTGAVIGVPYAESFVLYRAAL